jgi:hypothetical protein
MIRKLDCLVEDVIEVAGCKKVVAFRVIECSHITGIEACIVKDQIAVSWIIETNRIHADIPYDIMMHNCVIAEMIKVYTHGAVFCVIVMDKVVPEYRVGKICIVTVEHAKIFCKPSGVGDIIVLQAALHEPMRIDQVTACMADGIVAEEYAAPG